MFDVDFIIRVFFVFCFAAWTCVAVSVILVDYSLCVSYLCIWFFLFDCFGELFVKYVCYLCG